MTNDQMVQCCKDAHNDPATQKLGCSGCIKFFAKKLNVTLPEAQANALIDYLNANWTKVDKVLAQVKADHGDFVIAGKKAIPNGHVVVVLPGGPVDTGGYNDRKGNFLKPKKVQYPRCCSMSSSSNPWPGAISTGDRSTFDPWYSDDGVEYWAAPAPKS